MKILLANWVYNWGSTGFIVRDLKSELTMMGHDVIVATAETHGPMDEKVYVFAKPIEWNILGRLARFGWPRFRGSTIAAIRLIKYIKREKPDIINIHLLHGGRLNLYYLLKYLGKHHIKTVVTNHAELYYTGCCEHAYDCMNWVNNECKKCPNIRYATYAYIFGNAHMHWKLMKKAFSYFSPNYLTFTAVSPWLKDRFYLSPIVKNFDCTAVLNGLDTNVFSRRDHNPDLLRRIGLKAPNYILHVTASFNPESILDVKGGYYLVELAKKMPDLTFLIVCTTARRIESLPFNIVVWGKAKDQEELAHLFSQAQMSIIVSRRETFSMVTAESLCCGTPVVGFKAGGPESIAIKDASCFVEHGDVDKLAKAIREMSSISIDRSLISKQARDKYCSQTMAKSYLSVYDSLLNS